MPEYKSTRHFTKQIEDRTVTGLFAIHGNIDDGGDRSHPGAFADTTVNGRDRVVFLWQHNSYEPPTAAINYVREVSRADLPEEVLNYAPDATGGAEVSRTYLETPRGNEILAGLRADAIDEMSYAYELSKYAFTEDESTGNTIRELYGIKLFDISDVLWGMNSATLASKGLGWEARPLVIHSDDVKAIVASFIERVRLFKTQRAKAGRVFSAANYTALEGVATSLEGLAVDLRDLLEAAEPKQQQQLRHLWLETQRTLAALNGVRP